MAKSKSSAASSNATVKPDNPLVKYFKETRAELRKVTWPTRQEAQNLTMIIVAVSTAMAIFLGLLDFIFQEVATGVILGDIVWIILAVILFFVGAAIFYFNGQQD